ncbi:L-ascorbate metabolism protein UlaG (beta-lactamase superfamily) [Crossiella equi]|uniref:L-ascorbate metabolism protein UlaG (Beta-lactamase superfamily) n=1 Tax=Crossiella equi TaxID=130796 RepID=A0ABS5A5L0_9PSEU|nr:MBL fold metallo-hydrolase [Crossiella equi]MBP2471537.1 L-ascorbate metabolism protein UlaG (beta-lactamase superfamily) [Crossiella equi]
MRLTKFGHACVRIEHGDETIVIDPGAFTEPEALDGATAVLVTHEHFDHFDGQRLHTAHEQNPGLRVWAPEPVASQLPGWATTVGHGDAFQVGGVEVQVHGTWHAEIHPDIPLVRNSGFLVGGSLFHPGDALTTPEAPVDTLLLPLHAPWSRLAHLIDYLREVKPRQAYQVHDSLLSDTGRAVTSSLLGERGPGTGVPLTLLGTGESVAVG